MGWSLGDARIPEHESPFLGRGETGTEKEGDCQRCGSPVAKPGERWGDGMLTAEAIFCGACIDRCHEATDFAHVCQVCATPDEAAQYGWPDRPQAWRHWCKP